MKGNECSTSQPQNHRSFRCIVHSKFTYGWWVIQPTLLLAASHSSPLAISTATLWQTVMPAPHYSNRSLSSSPIPGQFVYIPCGTPSTASSVETRSHSPCKPRVSLWRISRSGNTVSTTSMSDLIQYQTKLAGTRCAQPRHDNPCDDFKISFVALKRLYKIGKFSMENGWLLCWYA